MVTGSPVLLSLFQWENKNVDLITMGLLIFGIQTSSDLSSPTILEFSPEEPKCLKRVVVQVLGWLLPVSAGL